jgi:hypothetical protein
MITTLNFGLSTRSSVWLALVAGEIFTVLSILSLSPIGFLRSYPIMMTRLMASRLLRSGDRHFIKISREMGKLLTRFLLIRKDFGTTRLFEPDSKEHDNIGSENEVGIGAERKARSRADG